MLGELVAHSDTDFIVALAVMAISPGKSFEIRNRFDVPTDHAAHGNPLVSSRRDRGTSVSLISQSLQSN
jgi:hypothetical protein